MRARAHWPNVTQTDRFVTVLQIYWGQTHTCVCIGIRYVYMYVQSVQRATNVLEESFKEMYTIHNIQPLSKYPSDTLPADSLHLPDHGDVHLNVILWLGGVHPAGDGWHDLACPGQGHGVPQQRAQLRRR